MENPHDVDEAVLLYALIDVFACEMHPLHVVATEWNGMEENKNRIATNKKGIQQILLFYCGTSEEADERTESENEIHKKLNFVQHA